MTIHWKWCGSQISAGWIRVKNEGWIWVVKEALACFWEWTWWVRTVILTTTVLSRFLSFFSMFTMADSGVAASAQRRRRRSDHLRKCLICNESTELAQWPSDTTRQLFRPGSIPPVQGKYLQICCLCLYWHVGPHCHLRTPRPTLAKTSSLVFFVFRTLDIVWAFWLCIIWRCAMHECWSAWC